MPASQFLIRPARRIKPDNSSLERGGHGADYRHHAREPQGDNIIDGGVNDTNRIVLLDKIVDRARQG